MDEFRKAYEYEEESGVTGILLLFFVFLVSELIFGAILLAQVYKVVTSSSILHIVLLTIGIGYIAFILFTSMALFKIQKYAVSIIKAFLCTRVVTLTVSNTIAFFNMLHDKTAIGNGGAFQYHSVNDVIVQILAIPTAYALATSIIWYIYFNRSKKVKQTFGHK